MTTVNLAIQIPDAHMARVQAALRTHWGQVEDGVDGDGNPVMRDRTGAELVEELRQSIRKSIIDIVKTVEGNAAAQAARDAVAEVEAT